VVTGEVSVKIIPSCLNQLLTVRFKVLTMSTEITVYWDVVETNSFSSALKMGNSGFLQKWVTVYQTVTSHPRGSNLQTFLFEFGVTFVPL
jgi:hypothetical protein